MPHTQDYFFLNGGGGGGGEEQEQEREQSINFISKTNQSTMMGEVGDKKRTDAFYQQNTLILSTSINLHNINQSTMNTHFIQAQDIIVDRRGSVFHELVDDLLLVQ